MPSHPGKPKHQSSHNSSHKPGRVSPAAFARIASKPKFQKTQSEFAAGTLRSSSGQRVTDISQARAIGKSQVQRSLKRARGRRR